MSETEISKRLQSSLNSEKGGFNEIIALSQKAINNAMSDLLKKHPELTEVKATFEGIGTLDATLKSSQLSLNVTGQDNLASMYYCTLESGTVHYVIGDKDFQVNGWTIAWTCTFDKEEIDASSDEFKKVQNQIKQPGDFSISSLFFAFTSNRGHSDFNGADLSDDQKTYLSLILSHWYVGENSKWQDRQKRTLAYALHTAKPETTKPGEGLGPDGENNMLLYLQMTENRAFPDIRLLEYSGNYVSPGINGTIIIDRNIIWDSYLFRQSPSQLLSLFNAYTYAWIDSADIPDILAEQWRIAPGDPSHSSGASFYAWKESTPNALTWTWAPSNDEQKYHNTLKTDGGWNRLDIDCTTNNTLSIVPGASNINASGITDIRIKCQSVGTTWPMNWEYDYTIHVQITWQSNITIAATDGGLKFSLNLPADLTTVFQVAADPLQFSSSTAGFNTLESVKQKNQGLQDQLVQRFKSASFGDVEKNLEKDLNTSARFVIPGNSSLLYEKPIFNNNGDLMIEANYIV
ncbi:uncharacterized protein ACLA_078770 [Aspergillus clavatus NRRL 1]|uniref:Uncharacterized protein n=1 Tax=Aspergillus clavatus (strain ATCC 1007 / CBS 513.65 / DSM 816 / NCTC 3887 / NRRL 1 / QM 1276 / 107) TaxID=344612 RepID=A1CLZ9_ASPCL|nr:uncharacterized protein ACLA_078770 [Aspergillus clavatus NRRL 1]EAW09128.1 hypothetical protein ACLA_078770 [Aspergillus clavatus NRRL 1]